jgi:hypothetical protein
MQQYSLRRAQVRVDPQIHKVEVCVHKECRQKLVIVPTVLQTILVLFLLILLEIAELIG